MTSSACYFSLHKSHMYTPLDSRLALLRRRRGRSGIVVGVIRQRCSADVGLRRRGGRRGRSGIVVGVIRQRWRASPVLRRRGGPVLGIVQLHQKHRDARSLNGVAEQDHLMTHTHTNTHTHVYIYTTAN